MNSELPLTVQLENVLPEYPEMDASYRRAPNRGLNLSREEISLALANALRYVPQELHGELAPEFLDELLSMGRIYGHRSTGVS